MVSAGEINIKTISILIITILLPLLSAANILFLLRQWSVLTGKITRYYALILVTGAFVFTSYLVWNGFFALALWKY